MKTPSNNQLFEAAMPLTPEQVSVFSALAARYAALPRGGRAAWAAGEAARLGISTQTLFSRLRQCGLASGRKRRSDAGNVSLSDTAVMHIGNLMRQSSRANGKRLLSVERAAELADANGLVQLARVDGETGEWLGRPSTSTITRAMRAHGAHPDQLAAPAPHTPVRSLHQNHVWELDASVCVLYYLDAGGVDMVEQSEVYKNKLENLEKLSKAKALVTRYLITDHYSGAFHVRYFTGGETGETLAEFFLGAIQKRGADLLHGVPLMLYTDPGAANKAPAFRTLCRNLGVDLRIHAPKKPRAKGSVERHHNSVEREFEGRLTYARVASLAELNALALTWSTAFQSAAPHTRHKQPRFAMWQRIRREHLRIAPPIEVCRELLTSAPEDRTVNGDLTISFAVRGYGQRFYDVRQVPGVYVGAKVPVVTNPYQLPNVFVLARDDAGREVHHACAPLEVDESGQRLDAPVFGERYRAMPETPADAMRKRMDQEAWGETERLAIERKRRQKTPAYDGRIDPLADLRDVHHPQRLVTPGTPTEVAASARIYEPTRMTPVEAARQARQRLGAAYSPEFYGWLTQRYADGVTEEQLEKLIQQTLRAKEGRDAQA
jgi:transposase InsO family protein